jgi:glycosyltransferase involved in cell wall biosynthesis
MGKKTGARAAGVPADTAAVPVFLATHSTALSGPLDHFEDYLWRHGHDTVRIDHPLDSYEGQWSVLRRNGKPVRSWSRHDRGPFGLLWDFACTSLAALRTSAPVAVGANNFDTYGLLTARRLRLARKPRVIYYASDYAEDRFRNPLMNWIYMRVERSALRRADLVVSNTRRAESKRMELGLDRRKSVIVPNGVLLSQAEFRPKPIDKDRFVFVGSVTREHGLYELLATIKPLIGNLTIIGHGDDSERVLSLCEQQKIPCEVYKQWPHDAVLEYLRDFEGFGLAPYNRTSKWTHYCSPLKVSEYISLGVPVITSSVPEVAETIKGEKLGIVYERGDLEEIKAALDHFDASNFHMRAQKYYAAFNSDTLFERVSL